MKKFKLTCIIDDDPIFVFGAKRLMELANFSESFLVFNNGMDAIEHMKTLINNDNGNDMPEIMLLDLNMPIMDGWQFLEEFIQIKPKKPLTIYIVSSSIDPIDLERAKRYQEITDYVIKPINVNDLNKITQTDN